MSKRNLPATFVGTDWSSSLAHARWFALVYALGTAIVLGIIGIIIHGASCGRAQEAKCGGLTLVFPYFASCVLFFALCLWIVLEARAIGSHGLGHGEPDRFMSWPGFTCLAAGVLMTIGLTFSGMAGPKGREATLLLGCFVRQTLDECNTDARLWYQWEWADAFAAFANATSIAILFYLGRKCYELSTVAHRVSTTGDGPSLGRCISAFSEFMTLGSALLVASTLSLFLFFATAEELKAARGPQQVSAVKEVDVGGPSKSPQQIVFRCDSAALTDCKWEQKDAVQAPSYRMAASMAFVAGLAFSGFLFFLFAATSASLDDAVRSGAERRGKTVKDLLENEGAPSDGPTGKVLNALALLAPALTGALTLLISK